MNDEPNLAPLYGAMAKAFPEIEGASKDKNNPAFKTKYADLGSVIDAVKPALANHGLWFRQVTHPAEAGVCIETLICHESGCELSGGRLFVPADKQNAQGYGSALTYAKRYSLQTTFGISAEDDDGNAASAPKGRSAMIDAPSAPPLPDSAMVKACKNAIDALAHGEHGGWWTKNAPGLTDEGEKKAVYEYLTAHKARSRPMQEAA